MISGIATGVSEYWAWGGGGREYCAWGRAQRDCPVDVRGLSYTLLSVECVMLFRFSDPADPPSVVEAREKEREIIAGWIKSV